VSRWRRETRTLGLGATAIVGPDGRGGYGTLAMHEDAAGRPWRKEELTAALRGSAAAGAARRIDVALAPDVCRHWMHRPEQGLRSLAELRRVVTIRCAQLFGGDAGAWCVAADWAIDRPFVCAAAPRALMDALEAAARDLRLTLHVESALWLALSRLAAGLDAPGWLAWHMPSSLVLALVGPVHVRALHCLRNGIADVNDDAIRSALSRELQRVRLMHGMGLDEPVSYPSVESHDRSGGHWTLPAMPPAQEGAWFGFRV
jgi:hypothetical protein